MYALTCLGDCPICGDEIYLFKTRQHKRYAKCINESCGKTAYPLPKRGSIEPTGCICPKNHLPVLAIVPKLHLSCGNIRRQESKVYFWTDGPCFSCGNRVDCKIWKELKDDY